MKDKSFPIATGGLFLLIGLTAIYVFNSPSDDAAILLPLSPTSSLSSNITSGQTTASARARQPERTTTRLGDPEHPSQTEKVEADKYSSNPPKADYEKEILALANSRELDNLSKAHSLLTRIALLPPEGQVLAMEYATKLIPDKHYNQFRSRIFQVGNSDGMREAIMLDLFTRGDETRMNAMLEFLRQPPTATHEEIREFFVAYLDKDNGTDPEKWTPDVKRWLADNPE